MDPQQELFTAIRQALKNSLKCKVYDAFLPGNVPYPFVYLSDMTQTDEFNKSAVFGEVTQTIDVWNNDPEKRGTLSAIMLQIKQECYKISKTDNFSWFVTDMMQDIISDTSTGRPLMHGILSITFKFS